MSTILTYTGRPVAARLEYFFRLHPEWWTRGLCCLAWAVMLLHGRQHAGHEVHHWMPFASELALWMLMVAAMMLPMVFQQMWMTAARSLWVRRHRAIAGFLLGYSAPWLALGVVAAGLREVRWTHTYTVPAFGFAAAALWLPTRMHRRALTACHRSRPLAPVGWRADRDCLRFGGIIGVACVGSCWPLMFACAFAGHSLIAMTGGIAVSAVERGWFRAPRRAAMLGTLAMASYYAALAVLVHGFAIDV